MATEYPLSLIIKAVDKATAPLRAINERMKHLTAPVRKLNNSFKALADEAGIPRLMKSFAGAGKAIASVGRETVALGLKMSAMAAGAGYAVYRIMRGAVDAGDKLGEMAQRVGLSVDAYAQLQFAAAQADVEQEQFNAAMDQFNKRLGEAKAGGGPLLEFLNKVSPALARQVKGAEGTEEALGLMTSAFERVTDPSKRAALAAAVFGKSGLQMGQFLGQGSKAIGEQRRRYFELAGSQEKFAKDAGDADNAIRETETAFLGLRNAAAGELFPALTELARALADVLAGNRGALLGWARETGAAISAWVKSGGIDRLVTSMKEWRDTIGNVVDRLGGLKGVLMIVGAYMALPAVAAAASLASSLVSVGFQVGKLAGRLGMLLAPSLASMATAIGRFSFSSLIAGLGAATKSAWAFTTAILANPITWIAVGVLALSAAIYALYKNWKSLRELTASETWGATKEMAKHPLEALGTAKDWWGKTLFGGGAEAARPTLGAAGAGPTPAGGQSSEAHVTVDFANLPKGARVTQDPRSTAPLDLSMGYSMVTP
jgi:ATP:corrinoid adenosyltransferase